MEDIIVIAIIVVIVGLAAFYVIKQKKKGKKCIGCPYGSSCGSKNNCNCNSNKK